MEVWRWVLEHWRWVLEVWGAVFEEDALAFSPCFLTLKLKPAAALVRMFSTDAAGQEANWQDCSGWKSLPCRLLPGLLISMEGIGCTPSIPKTLQVLHRG